MLLISVSTDDTLWSLVFLRTAVLVLCLLAQNFHPLIYFLLKNANRLKHDILRLVHADRFDVELEHVFLLAQVNFLRETIVADALATRRAVTLVGDSCLHYRLKLVSIGDIIRLLTHVLAQVFNIKDAHGTQFLEVMRILTSDRLVEPDVRQESIICSAHRRPFSVRLADTLRADKLHLDLLTRSQLREQDVMVQRLDLSEALGLIAHGLPDEIARVHVRIVVQFLVVMSLVEDHGRGLVLLGANLVQFELERRVLVIVIDAVTC